MEWKNEQNKWKNGTKQLLEQNADTPLQQEQSEVLRLLKVTLW